MKTTVQLSLEIISNIKRLVESAIKDADDEENDRPMAYEDRDNYVKILKEIRKIVKD